MNPVLVAFQEELRKQYPVFAPIIDRGYAEHGDAWADDTARNIETMFGPRGDPRWDEAIRGYVHFSLDVLRSHKFFETHGRYEASSYEDLKRDYWENPEFMLERYLPGIFVSHFIWPQHYRLIRFFREEALPAIALRHPSQFCEVGVGSGLYSSETLQFFPEIKGIGYDISPHSLAFGKRVVDSFGIGERYVVEQRDVVLDTARPADFLICQEVLEHIEEPRGFLRALHKMTASGGVAYISAAVTSGQSDHLYLFREPHEVREMLEDAGFSVLAERTVTAEAANVRETAPRVSAFLLES
jgi:SAM-dependent methyltransferase